MALFVHSMESLFEFEPQFGVSSITVGVEAVAGLIELQLARGSAGRAFACASDE